MNFRSRSKGTEGGHGVLQIQNLGVSIIFIVHGPQASIVVQHGFLGFHAVILHQLGGNAEPHAILESTDLTLGVGSDLPGHRLGFAGLDIQLALEDMGGAEGTNTRLIALYGGQIISLCRLQKITYFLHIGFILRFLTYSSDAYIIQK